MSSFRKFSQDMMTFFLAELQQQLLIVLATKKQRKRRLNSYTEGAFVCSLDSLIYSLFMEGDTGLQILIYLCMTMNGRLRKGKACARPEDEETVPEFPHWGLLGERLNRPLIRPLSLEPSREASTRSPSAVVPPPPAKHVDREPPLVTIPPPPAKHIERERFFQDKKMDGSLLAGHMRGLSLHSLNGSSSHSGSFDSSD